MKTRVARYQADRTNQKLYFCRIYCQLAEAEQGQLQEAHIESALLHLYGGYLALLQEIARYYQLSLSAPTLYTIQAELQQRTQVSPEILRLQQLVEQDFLRDIEQACQQINYKPIPLDIPAQSLSTANEMRLPMIDVMAKTPKQAISTEMVRQWRAELLALIESLRGGMVEF